jgi:hypothetical protein
MRRTALAAALCLAACGTDLSAPPADVSGTRPVASGPANASATCVSGLPGGVGFDKHPAWECNTRIRVLSTNGSNTTVKTAITNAIAIWNTVYGQNGLPLFVTDLSQPVAFTVDVADWGSQTGTYYCGTTNLSTRDIRIDRSSSSTSCGGSTSSNPVQVGALSRLIAHELAHSIGLPHLSENGTRPGADHCVAALPDAGGLNGSLCQLEILHVKYFYGMYDSYVPPSTYIAHRLEVEGTTTAIPGESKTLTATPVWDGAAPGGVSYTWSSTNASVAQVSGSTGTTNVVQALSPGSTTIRARLNGSNVLVLAPQSGDLLFTVNPPAPPPPTGLNATSVTYNGATIRWTSGAADATTNLYYRRTGAATWTDSVTGIPAGITSQPLSGLASQTFHDVRAKHVRSGQSSTFTSTIQFKTLIPPPPTITNFRVQVCNTQPAGGKTYNYFTLAWDGTPDQTSGSYEIGMHTSSSSAAAAVILTVPGTSETGVVGGYLSSPTLMNRWFWVRYVRSGVTTAWVPLTPSPLASNQCLQ